MNMNEAFVASHSCTDENSIEPPTHAPPRRGCPTFHLYSST